MGQPLWNDNQSYPIILGDSFSSEDVSYHCLQYSFKPASISNEAEGAVYYKSGAQLGLELRSGDDEGNTASSTIEFKGTWAAAKEGECLLIFDGSAFRLERLSTAGKSLKPITNTIKKQSQPPSSVSQKPTMQQLFGEEEEQGNEEYAGGNETKLVVTEEKNTSEEVELDDQLFEQELQGALTTSNLEIPT